MKNNRKNSIFKMLIIIGIFFINSNGSRANSTFNEEPNLFFKTYEGDVSYLKLTNELHKKYRAEISELSLYETKGSDDTWSSDFMKNTIGYEHVYYHIKFTLNNKYKAECSFVMFKNSAEAMIAKCKSDASVSNIILSYESIGITKVKF